MSGKPTYRGCSICFRFCRQTTKVGVWNLDAVLTSDVAVLYLLPMRGFVFLLAGLLVTALIGGAQNPNCVAVDENGDEVTLRANSWDPVAAIGRTLANRYGINVSVEAPKWAFA